jgi:hypothetical protein
MKAPLLLTSALALLASTVLSSATVLVSLDTAAPTDYFANSTAAAGGIQWRNDTVNGRRDVGQSFFTPTALTLEKFTLQFTADASPGAGASNAAFTLSLYQVASASAVPTAGTAILTETGVLPTFQSSDMGKYITFDMANTALAANSYYALILTFNTQAAAENIIFRISNTPASYPGGQAIISTDGTTFSSYSTGADFVFYATAVPEPGTVALAVVAFVSLVPVLRRKLHPVA